MMQKESARALLRRKESRSAVVAGAILITVIFLAGPAFPADLKPETIQASDEYLQAAKFRNRQHLAEGAAFLDIGASEDSRLRRGEILVFPAGPRVPLKVPHGLIHDWKGAIFLPNATIGDLLRVTRDYGQYPVTYHPTVVSATALETGEWEDRFSMVVMNKSFFARSALDGEYHTKFIRVCDHQWYSVTEVSRMQEILEYGEISEHLLPEGRGTGMIWRLFSIARYEECDRGVFIELEAIALSRDIPVGLRLFIEPIVRRVSRSSIGTSLRQTADAVRSGTTAINYGAEGSRCPGKQLSRAGPPR